ncbi:hypothetical protein HK100_004653 [Physocladia obscura]|uniref:SP-RING-type domain-containing protein n=1 Tax=Physocladia obscura TaxID=109957 RepID=A0AAD5T8U4_9FUNG|nr:hypothetical protein HK100_004653 [Physocladia obscura]
MNRSIGVFSTAFAQTISDTANVAENIKTAMSSCESGILDLGTLTPADALYSANPDSDPMTNETIMKLMKGFEQLVDAYVVTKAKQTAVETMRRNLIGGHKADGSAADPVDSTDMDALIDRFDGAKKDVLLNVLGFSAYFDATVAKDVKAWNKKSPEEKYHTFPAYHEMREKLWDINHHNEPFSFDGSAVVQNGDEDEELAIVGEHLNIKCPIGAKPMEIAYTSSACKHSFGEAIMTYLGNYTQIECPVAGCNKYLKKSDLKRDKVLERRVRRQLEKEREEKEMEDNDTSEIVE